MTLFDLGWTDDFARAFDALDLPETHPARVVRRDANRYRVRGDFGVATALVPGRLREMPPPAVGDWLAVERPPHGDLFVIRVVLPRRSTFSRKVAGATTEEQVIAANLDVLALVVGLDGDFNLRRVERYLAQAWNGGALPLVLLNKADACPDADARRLAVEDVAPGVDVHLVSALHGDGLDALGQHLAPGKTVALVGSSGVGKSTLVNRLLGREEARTAAVRADDSRGRHTTTFRELHLLPGGGLLLDTPGLRELQLWASEESLEAGFSDIDALAPGCRFRDCTHRHEPGCAVQQAVEDGRLDAARHASYLKLQKELDYLARRQDASGRAEKQRGKEGAKMIREVNRHNPKRR